MQCTLLVDMGEAIEQLDSELAVNSQELQKIQHYKVINSPQHVIYMHNYCVSCFCLIGCGIVEEQC